MLEIAVCEEEQEDRDTSSRQYKAVIKQMIKDGCTGSMFTCVPFARNAWKKHHIA